MDCKYGEQMKGILGTSGTWKGIEEDESREGNLREVNESAFACFVRTSERDCFVFTSRPHFHSNSLS